MAGPDYPSFNAVAPAPALKIITELMRTSPPLMPGPALAILLTLQINRVRLFQAEPDGYTKVLERQVDRVVTDPEDRAAVGKPTSLDEAVRDALAELMNRGGLGSADIALDLTVGASDESSFREGDKASLLEGQDLATLSSTVVPPDTRVAEFELPAVGSYLTTAEAAAMLGVDKSTITRRIRQREIIGFRGFKKSLRIPKDQFSGGEMVAGVAEILALFECGDDVTSFDHKEAWIFLCSTLYPGDPAPRPIDRLRAASRTRPVQSIVAELTLVKESLDHGDHI